MPHIPRDKFTRWNRSHSILLPPIPRSPLQHPPPRGPVYCFTYSPTATGQQRYFVYKFWLLRGGGPHHRPFSADAVQPLPDSRQFRCTAVSRLLRGGTPCRQWTARGWSCLLTRPAHLPGLASKTWNELLKKEPARLKGMAQNAFARRRRPPRSNSGVSTVRRILHIRRKRSYRWNMEGDLFLILFNEANALRAYE